MSTNSKNSKGTANAAEKSATKNSAETPAKKVIPQNSEKAQKLIANGKPASPEEVELARKKKELADLMAQIEKAKGDIAAVARASKPAKKAEKTSAKKPAKKQLTAAELKAKEKADKAKAKAKEDAAKKRAAEKEAKAKAKAEARAKKLAEKYTRWDAVVEASRNLTTGKRNGKTFTKDELAEEADRVYLSHKKDNEPNIKECKLYCNHFIGMLRAMELAKFVPNNNMVTK